MGRASRRSRARAPDRRTAADRTHGAVSGRPRPARRVRARRAGDHRALLPSGRDVGGAPRRRQRDGHDEHGEREEPCLQPARARPARARAEEPRALPLSDEGARAGSGQSTAGLRDQGRQAGDLRRRHRNRAALADPQVGERRPDEPGHAPRGRAAAPRPVGRRAGESALRRRRRGSRLPRRLRVARRQRAPASPQARPRLRLGAAVRTRLGDDREPSAAGGVAARRAGGRDRQRHRAGAGADDRPLEPRADRRRARRPRQRPRRCLAPPRRPRLGGSADDLLREEPEGGGADPSFRVRSRRAGSRCAPAAVSRGLHARAAPRDRAAADGGRAPRCDGHGRTRARDRHRLARLRDLGGLSGDGLLAAAAVGTGGPAEPWARRARRKPGRARPVLHARAGDAARANGRGGDPRPRQSARARRTRPLRRLRGANRRGRRPDAGLRKRSSAPPSCPSSSTRTPVGCGRGRTTRPRG